MAHGVTGNECFVRCRTVCVVAVECLLRFAEIMVSIYNSLYVK